LPAILAVDDSRAVRTLLRREVRDLGVEVVEAEDGVQALERLRTYRIDLVLLDVTMPRMDGVETLRAMREAGNRTPVIMLTSESSTSVVDRVLGLGVSDYVLKPFKPDTLKEKVQQLLRARAAG
jgi:DNA-binding response OmpR family regulator